MKNLEKLLGEMLYVYPTHDCIVKKDGETVARIIGRDETVHKRELTGKEKYNLYSCSKPITCVVALTLYEKGKFALDDDLAEYLPEFGDMLVRSGCGAFPAKNKIKVRDLFTMTAGFDYNTDSPAIRRFKADTDGKCPTALFRNILPPSRFRSSRALRGNTVSVTTFSFASSRKSRAKISTITPERSFSIRSE